MEWQPIETAPKDGTIVIVILSGIHPGTRKHFEPRIAYWNMYESRWIDIHGENEYTHWELSHWIDLPPKI